MNMPDLAFDPEYEISDGTLRYAIDVEQGYCYVVGVEYNGETKIAIPFSFEGLKVIGIANDAFANCQYITTVSMSESIAVIGERAFSGCTSLVSIKLSESISEIPWAAFEGCTSLQTIRIPEGVTYIDGYAFASCTSLRTLHLPNSLIKIDDHVIQDCYSLTRIDYAGTEARWNVIVKGVELGVNSGHYTVNFNYTY